MTTWTLELMICDADREDEERTLYEGHNVTELLKAAEANEDLLNQDLDTYYSLSAYGGGFDMDVQIWNLEDIYQHIPSNIEILSRNLGSILLPKGV